MSHFASAATAEQEIVINRLLACGKGILAGEDREMFLEVVQICSDAVTQDAWQTVCNLMIMLKLAKQRHPFLEGTHETCDNAPNYTAQLYLQCLRFVKEHTGIAIVESHNNEPNCGKNIGDTLGSVAARAAKSQALHNAIVDAISLATSLDLSAPPSHITRVAQFAEQPEGLKITASALVLHSRTIYDRKIEEAGMRFWQFYGIGAGLLIPNNELDVLLSGEQLRAEDMFTASASGAGLPDQRAKPAVATSQRLQTKAAAVSARVAKAGAKEQAKQDLVRSESEAAAAARTGAVCGRCGGKFRSAPGSKRVVRHDCEAIKPNPRLTREEVVEVVREGALALSRSVRGGSGHTPSSSISRDLYRRRVPAAVCKKVEVGCECVCECDEGDECTGECCPHGDEVIELGGMQFNGDGLVTGITRGSWAAASGIHRGDTILSVDCISLALASSSTSTVQVAAGCSFDSCCGRGLAAWYPRVRRWSRGVDSATLVLRRAPPPLVPAGFCLRRFDKPIRKTAEQNAFLKELWESTPGRKMNPHDLVRRMSVDERFAGKPDLVLGWRTAKNWWGAARVAMKKGPAAATDYDDWDQAQLKDELSRRGIEYGRKQKPGMIKLLVEADQDKAEEEVEASEENYETWTLARLRAECGVRELAGRVKAWGEPRCRRELIADDCKE